MIALGVAINRLKNNTSELQTQRLYYQQHIAPTASENREIDLYNWLSRYLEDQPNNSTSLSAKNLLWLGRLLACMMFLSGYATIYAALNNSKQVQVFVLLFFTLALPYLILLAAYIARLINFFRNEPNTPLLLHLYRLLRELSSKNDGMSNSLLPILMNFSMRSMQLASVGFYLGTILALAFYSFMYDVTFYWETSFTQEATAFYQQLTTVLASPWLSFWPEAVPDISQIHHSRNPTDAILYGKQNVWPKFLIMSLLVWGVLPRLLLMLYFHIKLHWQLRFLRLDANIYSSFYNELNYCDTHTNKPVLLDECAVVYSMENFGLDIANLRSFILNRLDIRPTQDDGIIPNLNELERKPPDTPNDNIKNFVLICEDSDCLPKKIERRLTLISSHFPEVQQAFLLIGEINENILTAPRKKYTQAWQQYQLQTGTLVTPFTLKVCFYE